MEILTEEVGMRICLAASVTRVEEASLIAQDLLETANSYPDFF